MGLLVLTAGMLAAQEGGRFVTEELRSEGLAHTPVGTNPARKVELYLPAGYEASGHRYPVIYLLPNPLAGFSEEFFERTVKPVLDHAIAAHTIPPFVLVAADMATPYGCTWYVNSPVTGNWEDFMVHDLVPWVDGRYRTAPNRNARGIVGDFMGGYGAIRFGMTHPEVFGTVYALHPVGTGSGLLTMYSRPDWEKLAAIESSKKTDGSPADGFANIFLSIFQASVPDVTKPPAYVDLQARGKDQNVVVDSAVTERLRDNFLLETMIGKYADNLKTLRGLRLDWARNDGNQDHVYSNQAFTHKLNEFGIRHEAEEYNGVWGTGNWGAEGRVATEVLPFLARTMAWGDTTIVENRSR
ncbi:MAG TPA: alpha/beta hydrolase-fold protein [Acidobacteriaceae bacterium]